MNFLLIIVSIAGIVTSQPGQYCTGTFEKIGGPSLTV